MSIPGVPPERRWLLFVAVVGMAVVAMTGIWAETAGIDDGNRLDKQILKLELPRNVTELRTVATPHNAKWWARAQYWDFVFILAYVWLFILLAFPGEGEGHVVAFIAAAGVFDCCENISLLICLNDITRFRDPGSRASGALPFFGALKWFCFFFACRAVAQQYSRFVRWGGAGVLLRAFSVVGAWATVLALVGLPSRPIITLAMSSIAVIIAAVLVLRAFKSGDPGVRIPTVQDEQTAAAAYDLALRARTETVISKP